MVAALFVMTALAVLGAALGLVALATLIRPAKLREGATPMTVFRRNRLIAGLACFAAAAVVAIVGYLKISIEPEINRQIPYLASAGMLLVILAVLGGALLVGEQLRTDAQRIDELEASVTRLAAHVAGDVERPARRRKAAAPAD